MDVNGLRTYSSPACPAVSTGLMVILLNESECYGQGRVGSYLGEYNLRPLAVAEAVWGGWLPKR
jgi:hypothetical protein